MAYKFQLGAAKLGGSLTAQGLDASDLDISNVQNIAVESISSDTTAGTIVAKDELQMSGTQALQFGDSTVAISAPSLGNLDIKASGSGKTDMYVGSKLALSIQPTIVEVKDMDLKMSASAKAIFGHADAYITDSGSHAGEMLIHYAAAQKLEFWNGNDKRAMFDNISSQFFGDLSSSAKVIAAGDISGSNGIHVKDASGLVQPVGGLSNNNGKLQVLTANGVFINPTGDVSIKKDTTPGGNKQIDALSIDLNGLKFLATASYFSASLADGLHIKGTSLPNSVLVNSAITINGTSTSLGGTYTMQALTSSGAGGLEMSSYNGSSPVSNLAIKLSSADALETTVSGLDLKPTIAGPRTFSNNVTINGDLVVLGSTFSASVGTLIVEDSNITVGDGLAAADGSGLTFGSTGQQHYLQIADSVTTLSSSLALKAPSFIGNGSQLTNVAASYVVENSVKFSTNHTANFATHQVFLADSTSPLTLTLAAANTAQNRSIKIKNVNTGILTVDANGAETIEGAQTILLETLGAAVTLWSDGTEWLVF